ncbi:hypothetical protein ACLQ24_26480 [Micromonospora sp. DT4]|uniref:hypothetical protein n=1 Tax=Micromonospora sp. DT4 TaxID=3393438 RepID=UPI003CEC3C01
MRRVRANRPRPPDWVAGRLRIWGRGPQADDTGERHADHARRSTHRRRGHFPTDDAMIKLIWLAIADIDSAAEFGSGGEG